MNAKLNGCGICTQIVFILINLLFLLIGAGLIAGGSVLVHNANSQGIAAFQSVFSIQGIAALVIIAGIVTFAIAAFAIIAAVCKSKILLGIYIVVVFLIILLELVAGVLAIYYRGKLDSTVDEFVDRLIANYVNNTNTTDPPILDAIQNSFLCCGWNNSDDYPEGRIPTSCLCPSSLASGERCIDNDGEQIWKSGCKVGVLTAFRTSIGVVAAVGIFFALIEVIAVLLACGLCCCIKKEYGTLNES